MSFTFTIGTPFIELQRVESTNNYAIGALHAGMAQHGTAVFAHHQTAGKGQRNKQWFGEAGKNIALSVIVKPDSSSLSGSFLLSMAAAVAVQEFFTTYAGDEVKVKWPNDIYWRDRKAAGILIENIVQGTEWKAAVIGIGININQVSFEGLQTKAVSLKQITGKAHEPVVLAKELCTYLSNSLAVLKTSPLQIMTSYKSCLYKKEETVRLKKDNRVFNAVIKDVSVMGELIVHHATEERFSVGEVEWQS
ncbi:MAG TPA: biotin--[acetyl-CoA-carboxylase] ligase [Flavisolibacter sp.]|nr:biotin--[acetyl-CoA-carboxylase] ligase [Flavisolibacter sp.]